MLNKKRNMAKIVGVFAGHEDHGSLAVFLDLDIDDVGTVRFGYVCATPDHDHDMNVAMQRDLLRQLTALFGVVVPPTMPRPPGTAPGSYYFSAGTFGGTSDPLGLVGRQCWALFAQGHHNEPVAGIENMNGERFTAAAFDRKYGRLTGSSLERKTASIDNEIWHLERKLAGLREDRETIHLAFTDWETAPPGHLMPEPEPACTPAP